MRELGHSIRLLGEPDGDSGVPRDAFRGEHLVVQRLLDQVMAEGVGGPPFGGDGPQELRVDALPGSRP